MTASMKLHAYFISAIGLVRLVGIRGVVTSATPYNPRFHSPAPSARGISRVSIKSPKISLEAFIDFKSLCTEF